MAAPGRSGLEELELTAEEVERLKGAFRDERFRALLAEYAAELADPEQRRLYEAEVAALERERGVEVRFVHPAPGYVLRTSQGGAQRCYLNVCSNPLLGRPQARPAAGGQRWSLPYSLAPGREELGRAGRRRLLYDVVFHPETLRLAARSARFRRMVSDTALEAVQSRFGLQLDRANATPLRGTAYKGVPQAAVIRTPLPGGAPPRADEPDSPLPPFPYPDPAAPGSGARQRPAPSPAPPGAEGARPPPPPTTPRWSLRHRSYVDLQDYRCCRDSAPSPVPRELVVTIELPLLSSAGQAALEIRGQELRLDSQRPAYRLRLRLPYPVDENRGQAAFNKAKRQLLVTLPVVPPPRPSLAAPAQPGGTGPEEPEVAPASSSPGLGTSQEQESDSAPEQLAEAGPGSAAAGEEELGLLPTEQACAPGPDGGGRAFNSLAPPVTPLCPGSMDLTTCTTASSEADRPSLGGPSNGADLPPCPSSSLDPAVPTECLSSSRQPELPESCSSCPDLPVVPSSLATPLCPPFQCTQDEESLTLLLQVPNIQPQSFKGEIGTNHYRLSFSSEDAASYSFLLQFPLENKLTPQETGINISPNNAVIGLTKSPESAGLWGKMFFGLNSNTLQERLFVSEENVDEFLDNVLCPSFLKQSTLESQLLIEVLDVTEDKSQIRLKALEVTHCELDEKEQTVNNSGRDQVEKENGNHFKTNIEANHTAADTVGEHGTETDMTSGSFTTAKTIDCSSDHCLQLEPVDTSLATSGKSQISDPQLELAFTTGKSATSSDCEKQEIIHLEEQAKITGNEEVISSKPADKNQHSLNSRAVSPILKEINLQDGSMQIVRDHTTHCALIFQNSLLYELD